MLQRDVSTPRERQSMGVPYSNTALQVNMQDTAYCNFDLLDKVEQRPFKAPYFVDWYISFQTKQKLKDAAIVANCNRVISKANPGKIIPTNTTTYLSTSQTFRPVPVTAPGIVKKLHIHNYFRG